jgi:large subunit ribosomal protein L21
VFAIIQSGGRQVRVEEGGVVTVDHIDEPVGNTITFDKVLFIDKDKSCLAGQPFIDAATVTGIIDEQGRGEKIRVFRKKRRKAWRRTLGHRTALTKVRITSIETT